VVVVVVAVIVLSGIGGGRGGGGGEVGGSIKWRRRRTVIVRRYPIVFMVSFLIFYDDGCRHMSHAADPVAPRLRDLLNATEVKRYRSFAPSLRPAVLAGEMNALINTLSGKRGVVWGGG